MKHLRFYVIHAWRDMSRNGRRTAFALFCIAAGVAAIVALRSLSLMIGDSLSANIAGINHGDLRVEPRFNFDNLGGQNTNSPDGGNRFTPEVMAVISQWAEKNNVQMTSVITDANIQVAPLDSRQNVGRPQFISSFIIDPAKYPFYGPVLAVDPKDVPLSRLFTGGNDVVISQNLAENNQIKVGDQVRVGRTTALFTVRGIVPTEIEGSLRNPLAAFFGFAYFDKAQSSVLKVEQDQPSEILMLAPPGADVNQLKQSLNAQVPGLGITTTADVRKQNQTTADIIDRLIIVMGLAALLIGATGIIHTMLVVVGRRTVEIAVLKTLGVQGRQITIMFLVESVIMGLIGSLAGLLLGIVFSLGVRSFTQSVWPQTLVWRIYPEALLTGLLLGVIITAVFGFLPTLTAAAVRPAIVLRPNETKMPASGCLQTLLALVVVVVAVGLIAGQLIGNLIFGLVGVAITTVIMSVLVGLLWLLIYVVGVLPSFGSVDLRLALRGIGTHRVRTASTLLALIAGIFSLSIITLMADSVPRLLNFQFTNALGGNVMIVGLVPALQRPFIIGALKGQPGVERYFQISNYSGRLVAVNGDRDYVSKIPANSTQMPFMEGGRFNRADFIPNALGSLGTVDVTAPGYTPEPVTQGRPLEASDSRQPNAVLHASVWTKQVGLKPGDKVTLKFGSVEATYTIVGLTDETNNGNFTVRGLNSMGVFSIPVDSLPAGVSPSFEFTIAKVDEAHLNQTLVNLSAIPGVLPFDISFFEQLIKRVLAQFTAIPTIVAVLSLFAGAVIIANTVSLTTLERRRQVGVMKAIGLNRRRVLLQMVLENGLIGLLGGLIGVGIGVLATLLLSIGTQISITQSVSWGVVGLLLLVSLLISLVATLMSAWTAATEKPLHVLRYE
jgi:predicted lysophospholipase L1 biosynthesis ABC-type transport system permease subunit